MAFTNITESDSLYRHLEKMSVREILEHINEEDKKVPAAITEIIPAVESLVAAIVDKMIMGGRLFYIGAGTSGRLGIVDASECPPTFGVPPGLVIGIIAGGSNAVSAAVEFAEDNIHQGWLDLQAYQAGPKDFVIGIAASGSTPYVIHALENCVKNQISTGSISCNPDSPLSSVSDFPVEIVVGPEFVSGSTRMKSGTAQKLVLNMVSTSVMIQLGRIKDNKMVHMQLSNNKLINRAVKIVMEHLKLTDYGKAKELLLKYGSVKKLLENYHS